MHACEGGRSHDLEVPGARIGGCGGDRGVAMAAPAAPETPLPAQAAQPGDEWPAWGHDPGGQRFSPTINRADVHSLKVAWTFRTGDSYQPAQSRATAFEATPLYVDCRRRQHHCGRLRPADNDSLPQFGAEPADLPTAPLAAEVRLIRRADFGRERETAGRVRGRRGWRVSNGGTGLKRHQGWFVTLMCPASARNQRRSQRPLSRCPSRARKESPGETSWIR